MSDPLFQRAAIIGLGQMGTTLALALRDSGAVAALRGYDLNPEHRRFVRDQNIISDVADALAASVKGCDLVILCTPVGTYASIMQEIASQLEPGAVMTDIGSIKLQAIRDLAPHVPAHVTLIPSHPVSGSEKTGPRNANAALLKDKLWVITPLETSREEDVMRIKSLWERLGSWVSVMPPDTHDQLYAYMSHEPQLMAYAASWALAQAGVHAAEEDEIFRRFIRIGRSDPVMWRDVFLENRENVLNVDANAREILRHMRNELAAGTEKPAERNDDLVNKELFPRMIASALVMAVTIYEEQLGINVAPFAAGGFRDVTAPAMTEAEAALPAFSEHAEAVVKLVDRYLEMAGKISDAIEQKNSAELLQLLGECQSSGMELIRPVH